MESFVSDRHSEEGDETAARRAGQFRPPRRGSEAGDLPTQRFRETISGRRPDHPHAVQAARESLFQQMSNKLGHELRDPLGTLRLSSRVLRQALRTGDPRALGALDRIERSVARCDRVLEGLFDFTRIAAVSLEPAILDVWLARVFQEQKLPPRMMARLGLPGRNVRFDKERLRCAVINVFENACQALGEGAVDSPVCERLVVLRTGESNQRIEIVIEDNGSGIAPNILPMVFEPLFSTKSSGMGLGLPVARRVMELHGGGIEIETEEGRGTRVCLWLPSPEQHESKQVEPNRC